jgi:hypothetical protein
VQRLRKKKQREALFFRTSWCRRVRLGKQPAVWRRCYAALEWNLRLRVSKTTGEKALALAKNDALFQALLNSDNEDVALLCEARLAVKSTLERTRAQRFLDIAQRGSLPVPLNYYGAHTGRWSASKGSGLNLQNLKRGSFLRKSIMAPDGTYACGV